MGQRLNAPHYELYLKSDMNWNNRKKQKKEQKIKIIRYFSLAFGKSCTAFLTKQFNLCSLTKVDEPMIT